MGHEEVLAKIVQANGPLGSIDAVIRYFPIYKKVMLEIGITPISMGEFSNLYTKILFKLGMSKGLVDPSDGVHIWLEE
jgi:hypothetical protein